MNDCDRLLCLPCIGQIVLREHFKVIPHFEKGEI
jgi:hypothetical protein